MATQWQPLTGPTPLTLEGLTAEADDIRFLTEERLADPPPPPEEAARAALDAWIDRRLYVLGRLQQEMAENAEVAAIRQTEISAWLDEQNAVVARRAEYLAQQIGQVARNYPYPKGKSRELPGGKIGMRAQRAKLEILDHDAALAWAEAHMPDRVNHKQWITATPLREWVESTGEQPDGTAYHEGGQDEPFVKPKGGTA